MRYWSLSGGMRIQFLSTNISTPRGVILKCAGRQSVLLQQGVPHPSRRCEYMSWARTVLDPITRTASAHASEALNCTAAPVLSVPEKGGRTRFWNGQAYRKGLPRTMTAKQPRLAMAGGIKRWNDGGRLRRQPPPPRSGPIVARSDPSAGSPTSSQSYRSCSSPPKTCDRAPDSRPCKTPHPIW